MKHIILLATMVLIALSLNAQSKKYGKELTLTDKVPVSAILSSPQKYNGKKVQIEGTIVNVCESRGCWIEVSGDKPYTKIKVKVNDGEIVFPVSEKGKKVTVEGEVYASTQSKSDMIKQMMKESKEHGTKVDTTKASDSTWYQIKGFGAVIK